MFVYPNYFYDRHSMIQELDQERGMAKDCADNIRLYENNILIQLYYAKSPDDFILKCLILGLPRI